MPKLFEVWVSHRQGFRSVWEPIGQMRFNADFDDLQRAEMERDWYVERGYAVEIHHRGTISPVYQAPIRRG